MIPESPKCKGPFTGQYNPHFTDECTETPNEGALGPGLRPPPPTPASGVSLAAPCASEQPASWWAALMLGQEHASHREQAELLGTERVGTVFLPPAAKMQLETESVLRAGFEEEFIICTCCF